MKLPTGSVIPKTNDRRVLDVVEPGLDLREEPLLSAVRLGVDRRCPERLRERDGADDAASDRDRDEAQTPSPPRR